ncbi:YkyB family protein [Jeotgalibacillus soli]|uniref:YkyB family protein n=1 Tax=Jeotgalibacillus soli TaxID=889306 RepID=UPI0005979548|nr:YkyB family protein [Jeotgalibacillus soli]
MSDQEQIQEHLSSLSQAIFTVNRHAKTASNPKFLYQLKKEALIQLVNEGKAKKIGLQFSNNPGLSQQRSDVLIKCGEYLFHIPPQKEDFTHLPHLGKMIEAMRNPKTRMGLREAKTILQSYTGLKEITTEQSPHKKKTYQKPIFKRLGE